MKRLLLLALLAGGAACSDRPLATEPSPAAAVVPNAALTSQRADVQADLVADAVERILPTFGESRSAVIARSALRSLEATLGAGDDTAVRAALPAIENALDRIERDDPGLAADVAAIRLAIAGL